MVARARALPNRNGGAPSAMTFRNNIGPDAVAAATLAPSAFEPGLAPFKLLAAAAAVGSGRAGSGQYILDASGDD